jgi:uncharacterized protein (TIGR03790 family)
VKIRKLICRFLLIGVGICAIELLPVRALALEPDEIALVVNSNVPQGMELAKFYAQQRHIPDNRILVLDLPKSDQMPCRQYEDQVVPQVRDFLHTGQLTGKVKCLVTFYGVPLRIDPRVNTAEEATELQEIRKQLIAMPDQIRPSIEAVEGLAQQLNPDFKPDPFGDLEHLIARKNAAFREISTQISAIKDNAPRQTELVGQFVSLAAPLLGDKAKVDKLSLAIAAQPTDADKRKEHEQAVQQYNDFVSQASPLEKLPDDFDARRKLRVIAHDHFGLIQYMTLLRDQADYLNTTDSGAAFDSELAMVEWNVYTHKGFCPNPLYYAVKSHGLWPTLMVSRLDAPDVSIVKSMITNSIKVEQQGLTGKVVIDSLGVKSGEEKPSQAGYGVYDQYLRDLYTLLKNKTKLDVVIDEKPEVLPANSYDNVALYVGWYSVHNYIPCCKFNPGAVGYHIASYELISLRQPGENGWVHGLLKDGVVGTLGPVAEPFLGTFPHADEYFPLLLTGKLTLAEVYWKTCPAVSWMMACVGDPLYNPYQKNPALTPLDLPFHLRQALLEEIPAEN